MAKKNDQATKQDLQDLEVRTDKKARGYRDQILAELDKRFLEQDEKAREYRDQILSQREKDTIRVETEREENEFIKFDIIDLKGRVTKLENASKSS